MLSCLLLAFYLCNPNAPQAVVYAQPSPGYAYAQAYAGPPPGQVVVVQQQPAFIIPWVFTPGWGWGWWHGNRWHGNGWGGHWHR